MLKQLNDKLTSIGGHENKQIIYSVIHKVRSPSLRRAGLGAKDLVEMAPLV